MKQKNQQGTAVVVFETDLEKTGPLNEEKLTPIQKKCLSQLSAKVQDQIRAGYRVSVTSLASAETICDFNKENYCPPQSAIENLARILLPQIQEYYSHEENQRKFKEWEAEQKGK